MQIGLWLCRPNNAVRKTGLLRNVSQQLAIRSPPIFSGLRNVCALRPVGCSQQTITLQTSGFSQRLIVNHRSFIRSNWAVIACYDVCKKCSTMRLYIIL